MVERPKILVIDDEAGVRDLVCDALSMSEFSSAQANDGLEALSLLRREKFDLLILDINMPKLDGLALLEKLRNEGASIPVLMLSARADKADINQGLRLGADDYLTKPFSIEELVLRVKAILRRSAGDNTEVKVISCGPITMDLAKYQVKFNDELLDLSPTEFKLLEQLILHRGNVVTKETLLSEVWEIDFKSSSTVVDTYISYLRKKLSIFGFEGIKTVRGIGFQIVSD
ncbi:MAG: DNA-binding response regulator [Actinobacteria bacterium]|jgi:two-component system OmpR family response regulator|nr:DNA-binding response regulator [Actinomycetota bacterium]